MINTKTIIKKSIITKIITNIIKDNYLKHGKEMGTRTFS